jgi:hypothetical protein
MSEPRPTPDCGTVAPNTEPVLDAVREANGRRPIRPAATVEEAAAEVEAYLVVPEWAAGEPAADVAAEVLRDLHSVEPATAPYLWALYAEGARRLGFGGPVPVPTAAGTGRPAEA